MRAAGASGLMLASLACGPAVSLDANEPAASSSSSDTTGPDDATGSTGSTGSTSASPPPTDEPLDDLPPPWPGECAPGCEIDLPVTWTWDGETFDPEQRLSAMLAMPDGGWVVATTGMELPLLTRISANGTLEWSAPASLDCDCEIADLALDPAGKLVVLGQGTFDGFYEVVALGRFDLEAQVYEEKGWTTMSSSDLVPAHVGSVVPIDEIHTVVLVVETYDFTSWSSEEYFEIYLFEHDYVVGYDLLDTRIVDTASPAPRGLHLGDAQVVMTVPAVDQNTSYLMWIDVASWQAFDAVIIPGAPEVMAGDPDGELVFAGHLDISVQQLVLQISGFTQGEQPWAYSDGVLSTTTSAPALTVDTAGGIFVAQHTTAGTPEDPRGGAIELIRLHEGHLVWSTSLPLALHPSPRPVAIDSTPDGGLVLAGIADGRLHLERREQGCQCD